MSDHLKPAPQMEEAWVKARQAVKGYQKLSDDWDDDGAIAPSSEIVWAALRFLELMQRARNLPPTVVYPHADGSIFIEWHAEPGTRTVANVFHPDKAIVVYADASGKTASERLEIPSDALSGYWLGGYNHSSDNRFVSAGDDEYSLAA